MVNPPADFESEIESRKFKIGLTTNKVIRTKKEKGKSRDGENLSVSFLIVSLRVFLFLVTSIFLIGGEFLLKMVSSLTSKQLYKKTGAELHI